MVAPSALTGVSRLCYGFGRRLRRRMVLDGMMKLQTERVILYFVGWNSVGGGQCPH